MVRIKVRVIGKIKEPFIRDAIADYSKRISSYCQIESVEYPEAVVFDNHASSREGAMESEGIKLVSGISRDDCVIALDRNGKQYSSEAFADIIKNCEVNGPYQVVFLIGGPHGLSLACKERADYLLSFSQMTFPHQLARLILFEQIYRAFTILRGLPYHR